MSGRAIAAVGVALLIASGVPSQAADKYRGRADGIVGYVTAESRYGAATISGPVRHGPYGRLEVRAPGGTWFECGRSCSDTLRRETIDFWENHQSGPRATGPDGPGYLLFKRY